MDRLDAFIALWLEHGEGGRLFRLRRRRPLVHWTGGLALEGATDHCIFNLDCRISCLLAYLLTYFLTYLLTYLITCLLTNSVTLVLTYLLTHLLASLLAYLLAY